MRRSAKAHRPARISSEWQAENDVIELVDWLGIASALLILSRQLADPWVQSVTIELATAGYIG